MPTYKKGHHLRSIQLDCGSYQAFDNVAAVGAAVANTTVQARLPIAQRCKIMKVVANFSAIGTGGAHSINIVQGTGAEVGIGATDTIATAGTTVFASDVALTSAVADTPTVIYPASFDTIYETGSLLTLRAVTPATTGSFTNLKVTVFLKAVDGTSGANTLNPNSDGSIGFGPTSF